MLNIEIEIVWLLLIASAVAMAIRWIRVPYTVALVIVGAVVGVFGVLPDLHLTPEVVFDILLPILLFEAAFQTLDSGNCRAASPDSSRSFQNSSG